MKILKVLLLVLIVVNIISCKEDAPVRQTTGASAIEDGSLDGQINGQNWSYISGRVKKSLIDPYKVTIELWETNEKDPCNVVFSSSSRGLLTSLPLKRGTYQLDNLTNVTFYVQSNGHTNNLIATSGSIVINSYSGLILEGKMTATFDNANKVSGTFSIPMCL